LAEFLVEHGIFASVAVNLVDWRKFSVEVKLPRFSTRRTISKLAIRPD
jgi:hypothetical protein